MPKFRHGTDALPLKPADFHILMVLLDEDCHGYGIMKAVEEESSGTVQLEVGSLYRLLARLMAEGLVEFAPTPRGAASDRRKYYRLTDIGRQAARAEALRLACVLDTARAKRLLGQP